MTEIYFVKNDVHFTKTEKKIIDYIIASPQEFIRMSIGDVARCIGSSEPTVSRFARHCGYADFKELKSAVLRHVAEENPPAGKLNSTLGSESSNTPEGFLRRQQYCIEKTLEFLDENMLEKAADTILSSDTIYLYAKGAAVSMAELLKFRLNRFGKKVIRLPAGSSELFEYMNFFTEKDLVILFGFQKTPKEAAVILDYQKKIHYKCIFFTSRLYHSLEQEAVIPLFVFRGEPSEYHSMAAPAALLDALVDQPSHDHNAGHNCHNRHTADNQLTSCQCDSAPFDCRRKRLCIGSENQERHILEQIADTNRRNQNCQR